MEGLTPADAERKRLEEVAKAEREKQIKAANQLERLLKRAAVLTAVVRKFIAEWTAARKAELDAARAAAEAKKNKKKGKKKKEAAKEEKGDPKKKKPKTPVAEAWSGLMSGLDEVVNKNKRATLEDLYRAVELMGEHEVVALRGILATANKKVLPTEGMNLNQLNLKAALWAAAAAHEYVVDKVALSPPPLTGGLAPLRDKGLSAHQLAALGYRPSDLVKGGFTPHDVLDVALHQPAHLRAAGLSVADVVEALGGAAELPAPLQGYRGVAALRKGGYSAAELVAAGLNNAWDLHRAGYSCADVAAAGIPADQLRAAGYGLPELQPPSFLGPSVAVVQGSDPRLLPPRVEGTKGGIWPRLLQQQAAPTLVLKPEGGTRSLVAAGGATRATAGLGGATRVPRASITNAPSPASISGAADTPASHTGRGVAWGDAGGAGLVTGPGARVSTAGSVAASVRSGAGG